VQNTIKGQIFQHAYNPSLNSFVSIWDTEEIDSYLLLLSELKFVDAKDERFLGTLARIEKNLVKNGFVCITPRETVSLNSATFDYINALISVGREKDARERFEQMLHNLNSNGILSESIDPVTKVHWGNFPQNNAIVGLITCAMRLSKSWDQAF